MFGMPIASIARSDRTCEWSNFDDDNNANDTAQRSVLPSNRLFVNRRNCLDNWHAEDTGTDDGEEEGEEILKMTHFHFNSHFECVT
jgi:hypothetical protein